MPKKSERLTPLPAGLLPLLSQPQLETYYGVSDWQVIQWIKRGMPTRPFAGRQRRFDLTEVEEWMARQAPETSGDGKPLLAVAAT
ncbi:MULTISPECIES: hypothetical protein [Streptomyces]|uniref:Helix-turn-helix domain-containing protein n=1 Tax=Streptomyces flavovirens TaxID=52258 RepID=A0ABV8NDW8_9ACTN|nr:hypothetical protein [Streptomyces sp. MBT51]MBK3595769.1 hypothetical protein [Streptomyces sp. MBT51]